MQQYFYDEFVFTKSPLAVEVLVRVRTLYAIEGEIRPNTLTRKNAVFIGLDAGARHWALAMMLIQTAKLNGADPLALMIDVLDRIVSAGTKAHEMHTLLQWTRAVANPDFKTEGLATYPA